MIGFKAFLLEGDFEKWEDVRRRLRPAILDGRGKLWIGDRGDFHEDILADHPDMPRPLVAGFYDPATKHFDSKKSLNIDSSDLWRRHPASLATRFEIERFGIGGE